MASPLQPIATAFVEALIPLYAAAKDPKLLELMIFELGWVETVEEEALAAMPWLNSAADLIEEAQALIDEVSDGDDDVGGAVEHSIELVKDVIALIEALQADPPTGSQLTGTLGDPDFWAELALDLPEYLLLRWMRDHKPILYGVLRVTEVVEEEVVASSGNRGSYVRSTLEWSRLSDLAGDPVTYMKDLYQWGGGRTLRHEKLLSELSLLAKGAGLGTRTRNLSTRFVGEEGAYAPDNEAVATVQQLDVPVVAGRVGGVAYVEAGIVIVPVPTSADDEQITGILVSNLAAGDLSVPIELSDAWSLEIEGELDSTGVVGLTLQPDTPPAFVSDPPDASVSIGVLGEPETPWPLIGASEGPRVELRGVRVTATFAVEDAEPELVLEAGGIDDNAGIGIVVEVGDGDAFLQSLLAEVALDVGVDPRLRWSSRDGFTFAGTAGFEIEVPVEKSFGPVYLYSVHIDAGASVGDEGARAALGVGVTAGASLGPFAFAVENVGILAELSDDPAGVAIARFGDLGLGIAFKPPDGLGVSIDASVVSGGGYLYIDSEKGEYAGVLAVELLGIGVTAIGLISTQLPDGSQGWSMFLSLSATFTGLQIGFGFTLNGVGGLVGVNRSLDVEALQDGLREGALDSIMFPEDPIGDAPRILSDLEAIFPAAQGQYVFGPMAKIGWGTPTLVEADVGIIIELPDPFTIAILGSVEALLPTPDAPIVELRMDVLGVLEFDAGRFSIDATLRDSKVLALTLTGEMAMRASVKDSPSFLLSVGGFHPAFTPPADFPSLALLAIALDTGDNLRIALGCYFGVTSNTLQFGASLSLWAKALGFTVEGGVSFDALIQFRPFGFVVSLGFYVSVSAGSTELMGVYLAADLTGPNEWYVRGTATFKILGVQKDFRVEATFGQSVQEEQLEIYFVRDLLIQALEETDAWSAAPPTDGVGVVLAEDASDDLVRVHPAARVEVRQKVVPLERTLDKFGNGVLGDLDYFALESPLIGGDPAEASTESVADWFAPGQFFETSEAQALSSPSFEEMPCGLRFGDDQVESGPAKEFIVDYEQVLRDPSLGVDGTRLDALHTPGVDALLRSLGRSTAASRRRRAGLTLSSTPGSDFALEPVTFVVGGVDDGAQDADLTGAPVSWGEAREALIGSDSPAGKHIVPAYEANE